MGFGQVIVCGKDKYYSQEAFSLVRETGARDPVAAIERLADNLLQLVDVAEPPVRLEVVASYQRVKSVIRADICGSGRLVPVAHNEYQIELRISDPVGRQNFTIGHEIGHTLIPSYSQSPTIKTDMLTGEFQRKNEEEFFCDIAARNLLLPQRMFREQCKKVRPSIEGLLELSSVFQASIEAVAIRLDQLRCWDCVPVIWELALKPSQRKSNGARALPGFEELSEPIEEYRVKFHAGNHATMFFPADKHIAADSGMVSACLSYGEFKGRCVVPTAKRDWECYVEAVVVPYRNEHGEVRRRIVSLAHA